MDASSHIDRPSAGLKRRTALAFVILLGVVSLFADMTYEGARSITGPYLAVLGASATVVGMVAGLGELIGYVLRLVAGYLSDRTGRYWTFTLVGYVVNVLAVPCLALAGRWELAALMIAERFGKAIRTPARDAMLSHATSAMGRGWGFGLHEAMDQIGALLGPLIVAAVLFRRDGYPTAFGVLLIPALLTLGVLVLARLLYPDPRDFEIGRVPYLIERIDRRTERRGRHLATEQVQNHPVYFHAELAERHVLPLALDVVGEDRLLYASDFPHEPGDEIKEVLEAFLAREDVSPAAKQKILCENIEALYRLQAA
jgi:MFS family permease